MRHSRIFSQIAEGFFPEMDQLRTTVVDASHINEAYPFAQPENQQPAARLLLVYFASPLPAVIFRLAQTLDIKS